MIIKEDNVPPLLLSGTENVNNIIEELQDLKLNREENESSEYSSECILTSQINGKINGSALCYVNFSGQNLTEFEAPNGYLVNVTDVDLSNNKLSDLPESFKCMRNVRKLNLSFNKFAVVPDCLYSSLNCVKYLDLSHNCITDFSIQPLCLPFLCYLNVSFNNLRSPPLWLLAPDHRKSKYLQIVDLSVNPCLLAKLGEEYNPHSWRKIADNVSTLILSNTGLTVRNAPFVKNFRNVKKLVLSNSPKTSYGNLLAEWPTTWWDMAVNEVELAGCWMGDLENLVSRLPGLSSLDISHNEICWLPNSITSLRQLASFRASSSSLIFLPTDFGTLSSLKHLHLPHNSITSLPESIYDLEYLETLDLYNNNINVSPNIDLFKKLKGFDVSNNYCETVEITSYEELKNYLRLIIPNGMNRCDIKKTTEISPFSDKEDDEMDSESDDACEESQETYGSDSSESEDQLIPQSQAKEYSAVDNHEEEDWLDNDPSNVAQADDDYDEKDFVEETEDDIIKRAEVRYTMHFYLPYQQPPSFFGTEQDFWNTVGRYHVDGQFDDH